MKRVPSFVLTAALLLVGALSCRPRRPAPATRNSDFEITATIRDLMDAEVDPAADDVWASVASVSTQAGFEDRQPRTADEWAEVRRKAIILIEATNLLVMPGRRVSVTYVAPQGPGELDSTEVQRRIDASPQVFKVFAHLLHESSLQALRAIDARNPADLLEAGSRIDGACEACHVTYWYPDEARR